MACCYVDAGKVSGLACVVWVFPRVELEVAVVEDAAAYVADSPAAGNSPAHT